MVSDRSEATEGSQELTEAEKVQFSLLRNATYHEDRASFFAGVHRFLMFLVVALGTGAFGASLAGGEERWHVAISVFAGVATLAGLIDLLWNVDGNARDHTRLAVDAMDRPKGQKYILSACDVFVRNVWRFQPNQFKTEDDKAKAASVSSAKSA
jgi:hypothetical protein